MRFLPAIFALVFLLPAGAPAAEVMPPKPAQYFSDYANVVDPVAVSSLNDQLAQFERDTSTQIVVTVFRKMETDSSVDDYTRRIAQSWGVGGKTNSNGAALFVFIEDHKMFIQTGYGVEGALPDATCFDITHNLIAPFFKKNDYTGGLKAGVAAMMQAVRGEYQGTGLTTQESEQKTGGRGMPFWLILVIFVIIMIMMSRANRGRRSGYGYSGYGGPFIGGFGGGDGDGGGFSGGGGGFSGGGGSFGGGGAGSGW